MSEKIVVVALGHRALGTTLPEQKIATQAAAKADWHDPHCNE